MTRLPTPGQDSGTWGDILNEFLSQELNATGASAGLLKIRTDGTLDAKYIKPDTGIPLSDLSDEVQTVIEKADAAETTTQIQGRINTAIADEIERADNTYLTSATADTLYAAIDDVGAKVLVLDDNEALPGDTADGTVVLRLPIAPAPDVTAPTAPTNVTVSSVTSTGATVTWTASTDAVGVAGYNVYLSSVKQNTSLISGTTYPLSGLTPSTTYASGAVEVEALDAASNTSTRGATTQSFTTSAAGGDTVIFSDTFNRADSSSVGNGWTADAGYSILSNRLRVAGPASGSINAFAPNAFTTANQYIEAQDLVYSSSASFIMFLLRVSNTASLTAWGVRYISTGWQFYRFNNGTATLMTTVTVSAPPQNATIRVSGRSSGVLTVYVNAVAVATYTDSTPPATGTGHGLRYSGNGTTSSIDNYEAGDLGT